MTMATNPRETTPTVELSIEIRKSERLKFTLSPAPGGLRVTRTMTGGLRLTHTMSLVFAGQDEWKNFLDADATRAKHRSFFDQVCREGKRLLP